jgi:hypothetical protein
MRIIALILTLALGHTPAVAHETKGPNGRRVTDLGAFHGELTAKGTSVDLSVTDAR